VIELDVVAGTISGIESQGMAYDKSHGFGFGFAHGLVVKVRRSARCNIS
jgi:hypothetical protein